MMLKIFWMAWIVARLPSFCFAEGSGPDVLMPDVRMNEIQTIGTHNSYRLAPSRDLLSLISIGSPEAANALDYSHRPLIDQLNDFHIRQIELDLYADPNGGLYANPIGHTGLSPEQMKLHPHPNADGAMDAPGMKVLHSPGFDYRSSVPTFVDALRLIREWSQSHPSHIPILILVELKQSTVGPVLVTPVKFDSEQLSNVDREIRSVFAEGELITPDAVRGNEEHLRDAISKRGWPRLNGVRGKVWFALDNEGTVPDLYLRDHRSLRGRAMFVSVRSEHSAAAFRKINDPVGRFPEIQRAVRDGLIVRTRADAETREARSGDTKRRDKAFQSGAQYISTDYPVADVRWSPYQVSLPGHAEFQLIPRNRLGTATVKE